MKLSLPASVTDVVGQTLKRSKDVTNIVKIVNCWLLLLLELQHAQIFKTSSYLFHERSGDEQFVTDDHFYLHLKVSMLQGISGVQRYRCHLVSLTQGYFTKVLNLSDSRKADPDTAET